MNQKAYHVAFPVTLVVVMVAFLSLFFFASADSSFAASTKKKSTEVAKMTAVEHTEARIKELKSERYGRPYQGQGRKQQDHERCRAYEIPQSNYRSPFKSTEEVNPAFRSALCRFVG